MQSKAGDISELKEGRYWPNVPAVFSKWGLYDPIDDWSATHGGVLMWLWNLGRQLSTAKLYCPKCGETSVFTHLPDSSMSGSGNASEPGVIKFNAGPNSHVPVSVQFQCALRADHVATLELLLVDKRELIKIGQYPSIADLTERELRSYRKLLGEERQRELTMAVRLHAHGVGIGSLIYLRRIFEFIVANAEKEATSDGSALPYDNNVRMAEKIKALAAFLPEFIVEERQMYGLLSDGVHNRSEAQCKAMFSPCLDGIEIALDHLETARARVEKSKKAKTDLAAVAAMLQEIEAEDSEKEQ